MFGTENRVERNSGYACQNVDCAPAFRVDAGLIGEQADFLSYSVAKLPAYRNVPITDLINNYGANDIITQLCCCAK